MAPRLLALEEHYYSQAIFDGLVDKYQHALGREPGLVHRLRDVGKMRLEAMEAGDVLLQVISHGFTPGGPSVQGCHEGNTELAAAIAESGQASRFAAECELDRCVRDLGFVGALIDNHFAGKHFDSPAYYPLWAKAVALDVPIYLHPAFPSTHAVAACMGDYSESVGVSLGTSAWGWHSDVGLHVLKLFAAGIFDRFPTLKVIIGHMGEMLPFMLERIISMSGSFKGGWGARDRTFKQVWDENIWITTSGCWSLAPMKCILENTKIEHIMYSVDYPFESNAKGRRWFEQLEASGLVTSAEIKLIGYRNAEQLLKLQKPELGKI